MSKLSSRLAVLIIAISIVSSKAYAFQDDFRNHYDKLSIKRTHNISEDRKIDTVVRFDDHIEFQIDNPENVELSKFRLTLYLDGQQLPGFIPLSIENDRLVFVLSELDTLANLLQSSVNSWGVHTRNVRMSFGDPLGNHVHVKSPNVNIDFDPHYNYRSWIGRFLILVVIFFFFKLTKRETFLRDHRTLKFSLSRSQLAWWTMIVICSYIGLWSDSGLLVPLTTDTLILLGISSATAAVAQTIDKDKSGQGEVARVKVDGNFFDHILSDGSGISIQRFQSVVFTFFIGVFFLYKVVADFEMPDIDSGILGLMGISSGTYAGLKTNENMAGKKDSDTGNGDDA